MEEIVKELYEKLKILSYENFHPLNYMTKHSFCKLNPSKSIIQYKLYLLILSMKICSYLQYLASNYFI